MHCILVDLRFVSCFVLQIYDLCDIFPHDAMHASAAYAVMQCPFICRVCGFCQNK